MAHIVEEIIQIKISTIAKDGQELGSQIADAPELIPTIESVAKELIGKHVVVEVEQIK